MSNTTVRGRSESDVASGVAQLLTPVVHHLIVLALTGKQAHWHVRGANFVSVHEFLDEVVAHAQDWSDLAAERIVALGLPIDARLKTIAERSTAPEPSAGFQQAAAAINEVIGVMDQVKRYLDQAIDGLAELDPPSQDVAIEIRRGIDKDRWFLFSHIAVN